MDGPAESALRQVYNVATLVLAQTGGTWAADQPKTVIPKIRAEANVLPPFSL